MCDAARAGAWAPASVDRESGARRTGVICWPRRLKNRAPVGLEASMKAFRPDRGNPRAPQAAAKLIGTRRCLSPLPHTVTERFFESRSPRLEPAAAPPPVGHCRRGAPARRRRVI